MSAADDWRRELADWAIPESIIALAPESPWIHPPILFDVPDVIDASPSHDRAREILPEGATVLDVGCGGGVAAFALTPPATSVIGVDHQSAMLEMFAAHALARGVSVQTHEGFWPAVASVVPRADVVTAHHVAYNVGDIVPFMRALSDHATQRVVIELPQQHPLAALSEGWRHFWGLERPIGPTPLDLMAVLEEMDISASIEFWEGRTRGESDLEQATRFTRVRLCLPEDRDDEVRQFLIDHPPSPMRALATIWWDVGSGERPPLS